MSNKPKTSTIQMKKARNGKFIAVRMFSDYADYLGAPNKVRFIKVRG